MTHAQSGAGQRSAVLELCRVSIQAERTQVDLALPTSVPLALLVGSIVDIINQHVGVPELTSPQDAVETHWRLSRPGQPPMQMSSTLGELEVRDGDQLILTASDVAAPDPLFDDVFLAVSTFRTVSAHPWSRTAARILGASACGLAAVLGATALLHAGATNPGLLLPIIAVAIALVSITAAVFANRVYDDSLASVMLSHCAVAFSAVAGALFVPGKYGAPHVMLALMVAMVVSILAMRATGTGTMSLVAAASASLLGFGAALGYVLFAPPIYSLGAVLGAVGICALALSPRVAMVLARLPLPPVPTQGAPSRPEHSTAPIDAIEGLDGLDTEGDDVEDATALPPLPDLREKALRAHAVLTGLVCGTSTVTAAGAMLAALTFPGAGEHHPTGPHRFSGVVLAGLIALAMMLRARSHADLAQTVAINLGGLAIPTAAFAFIAVAYPTAAVFTTVLTTIAAGCAIALGFVVSARKYSPVARRTVEIIEYMALSLIVPIAVWVCGVYSAVRGLNLP
ncbi:type VII secretion integral membrane protein EccD [Mycobacteroides chelonae]|uniref:type VII secretion integral membrane protein EccD n=1 Tax=Mycobacteroides chelonae TaxID=1774 RepID=UPI0008A973E9|nr:type VII secretion integral membrane protein EccD [Mycobacteroides chelonae]MBF9348508.1 type VII secretion integral membrane protein EccD [Mycobacteroides chelonae]OHU38497.1 type VII secretion integral membrane protein EccD [Mycobacteroides chelonae]